MGSIEISDGVSSRRIPTRGLPGAIRIELAADGGPRVVLPNGVDVAYTDPAE